MKLQPIIGLEIHVQLKTKSKMFCGCDNKGEDLPPNTAICPICTGQPGTLPVPNKVAVEWTLKCGLALNCTILEFSKFDRKNYFYPDLPKGYQISQYDKPIAVNGYLEITSAKARKKIRIRRIHLEEDAAKNFHSPDGMLTFVDFNRAGTPLLEIVTEPDLRSSQDAKIFMQDLRTIMRYLDVSDADMEKGHMRCDANINLWELGPKGDKVRATPIVEVKNMNSFRSLERALEYEIKRQAKEYGETKKTIEDFPKTTRGWNDEKGVTEPQRTKEEAPDYRYFPEPDIPPLNFSNDQNEFGLKKIRQGLPELPDVKRKRFAEEYDMSPADLKILLADRQLSEYAEEVISELQEWVTSSSGTEGTSEEIWKKSGPKAVKIAINWLLNKLASHLYRDNITIRECKITAENFSEFISLIYQNKINSALGQKILEIMYRTGKDPSTVLEEGDFKTSSNGEEVNKIIEQALSENPSAVQNYKNGKTNSIMFLVGQVMKKSKGKIDPNTAKKLLEESLK